VAGTLNAAVGDVVSTAVCPDAHSSN